VALRASPKHREERKNLLLTRLLTNVNTSLRGAQRLVYDTDTRVQKVWDSPKDRGEATLPPDAFTRASSKEASIPLMNESWSNTPAVEGREPR
jgi:hypothetical protein